ncbi:MAG: hypothetical protein PVH37_10875 [Desulfobacterales bacterium]|jgi:uncharacterized protein (TIGR03067 family)
MKSNVGNPILVTCFCVAIFISCNCQTELEGPWIGCEIRKPLLDWTFTVQDNHFSLIREDFDMWLEGLFTLNSNCVLKKIDLQINDTYALSQKGKTILGIYEIDRDTLTIVLGRPGIQERPLSLDEPSGAVVFYFLKG